MTDPNIIVIDTETSPHQVDAWSLFNVNVGIGQIRKPGQLLCWAAAWMDRPDDEVVFDAEWESGREHMVKHLHALYSDADIVVSYNGKSFDNKVANKEFLLQGLKPPPPYKNIDLLQTMRQNFKLGSNKLDFVSQQLGLGQKVLHPGHSLWTMCEQGDADARALMARYNVHDVVLTKNLYRRLLPWIKAPANHGLFTGQSHVCTHCGSNNVQRRGVARTKVNVYPRYQCNDCGAWSRGAEAETTAPERRQILRSAA